jgi:hypothetical protein
MVNCPSQQWHPVIVWLRVQMLTPLSTRCCWKYFTSSGVAVSGERPSQAANRLQARKNDQSEMRGRDCVLTYPRSCAHEGAPLVRNAECSWEYPLSIEAKSPRLIAHTRHQSPCNKSLLSASPATTAPIAKRFSARAQSTVSCSPHQCLL